MYNPISGDENDEFVELHNRASRAVNLTGWRLNEGIDFTFPTNTIISRPTATWSSAKNVARLRANYPNLNLANSVGNYAGSLANSGERITLDMPDTVVSTNINGVVQTNIIHIMVDEVTYGTGGRWGKLERWRRQQPRTDRSAQRQSAAPNWADSDDTAKSAWTTCQRSGTLDNGGGHGDWNALQFWLLERGRVPRGQCGGAHCRSEQRGQQWTFEGGLAHWYSAGQPSGLLSGTRAAATAALAARRRHGPR